MSELLKPRSPPMQAPVDGLRVHQIGPRDFGRRKAAQQPENQRDVRFLRERFVADREHHRELVRGVFFGRENGRDRLSERRSEVALLRQWLQTTLATKNVDGAILRGLQDPRL